MTTNYVYDLNKNVIKITAEKNLKAVKMYTGNIDHRW